MVYLVGAGPGDKGLITEKGKKCIQNADVIVFDKLACCSLLELANDECEFIYAGKQSGNHHLKQNEINDVLIEKALAGKNVVRLKGGDPFVFGRGGEEASQLRQRGIEFEIVPGVSSCYSVGAYAGIPVTHRDYASSFHVITGHENVDKEKSSIDFEALAKLDGTLVFLMSLKNLALISQDLIQFGKNPQTPCAVIQRGTTGKQKIAKGTLKTICTEVEREKIKTPALTIVGDVVSCQAELKWFGGGKLFGTSVMLTGTNEFNERIGGQLNILGAETLEISLIGTRAINCGVIDSTDFSFFSWIVFTSRNGVEMFFESLKRTKRDIRAFGKLKFAVLGGAVAEALAQYGVCADLVSDINTGAGLGELIAEQTDKADRVLLLRSSRAVREIDSVLEKNEVAFSEIAVYETYTRASKQPVVSAYSDLADYVVIASPSAADSYKRMKKRDIKIIAIGPTTAQYMNSVGYTDFLVSETPDAGGIANAIIEDMKRGTYK